MNMLNSFCICSEKISVKSKVVVGFVIAMLVIAINVSTVGAFSLQGLKQDPANEIALSLKPVLEGESKHANAINKFYDKDYFYEIEDKDYRIINTIYDAKQQFSKNSEPSKEAPKPKTTNTPAKVAHETLAQDQASQATTAPAIPEPPVQATPEPPIPVTPPFQETVAGANLTCGGGYPSALCNLPMDYTVDNWGMFNRECVSYAAFKVAESGRHMPSWGGRGNAKEWDDNARYEGIPVDHMPRAGDVAIRNGGAYGHAMYVEGVNADGTINISQYNADNDGLYSARTISPAGLVFIHF